MRFNVPYPRVWVGSGRCLIRVGSGTGTKSTGTGIPVVTRKLKKHHFSRCWNLDLYKMYDFLELYTIPVL